MCDIFEQLENNYKPTHVVSAITYGGNAHFVFEKKIDIDDFIDEIGGNLTAKYKMAVFEIEGSFSLDNNEVTRYLSNVSNIKARFVQPFHSSQYLLQIYSDFILEKQPIDLEEAIDIYQEISTNFGDRQNEYKYASPMYAQLIPVKVVSWKHFKFGTSRVCPSTATPSRRSSIRSRKS